MLKRFSLKILIGLILLMFTIPMGYDGFLGIEGTVYEWVDAPEGEFVYIY